MGVTIYSKNKSWDVGYGKFLLLRKTIAKLCPEEIKTHYLLLIDEYGNLISTDPGFKQYDLKTDKLYEKYKPKYGKVMDFLYAPDTDAEFSYGVAKQLLTVIGDYDDDALYGYAGWGEYCMKFKDFKNLLKDALETKSRWGWR